MGQGRAEKRRAEATGVGVGVGWGGGTGGPAHLLPSGQPTASMNSSRRAANCRRGLSTGAITWSGRGSTARQQGACHVSSGRLSTGPTTNILCAARAGLQHAVPGTLSHAWGSALSCVSVPWRGTHECLTGGLGIHAGGPPSHAAHHTLPPGPPHTAMPRHTAMPHHTPPQPACPCCARGCPSAIESISPHHPAGGALQVASPPAIEPLRASSHHPAGAPLQVAPPPAPTPPSSAGRWP